MEYNYIIIYKVGSQRQIRAKGEMFSYDVVVDVYPDMVTFTEHTIDNLKKASSFCETNSGWYQCTITSDILPHGKFKVDEEESREGYLVVYYEDVIED